MACFSSCIWLLATILCLINLVAAQRPVEQQNTAASSGGQEQDSSYFDGVRRFLKDVQERRPDMYTTDAEVMRLRQELQRHEQGGGSTEGAVSYQPVESRAVGTGVTGPPGRDERQPVEEENRDVDQEEKDLRRQQLDRQQQHRQLEQQQRQQHDQQAQQHQQQQENGEQGAERLREYYQDISGYLEDVKRTRSDLFGIDPDVQRLRNELTQYESIHGKVTPTASSQPVATGESGSSAANDGAQRSAGEQAPYYAAPRTPTTSSTGNNNNNLGQASGRENNDNIADPFAHDISGSGSVYATVSRGEQQQQPRDDANGQQQRASPSLYPSSAYGRSNAARTVTPFAYGTEQQPQSSSQRLLEQQQQQQQQRQQQQDVNKPKDEEDEEESSVDPYSNINRGEYDPYSQYTGNSVSARRLHEQALRERQAAEQQQEEVRRVQQQQDYNQYQDWRRRFFSRRQCTPEQLQQQHQQWLSLHQHSGILPSGPGVGDIPT